MANEFPSRCGQARVVNRRISISLAALAAEAIPTREYLHSYSLKDNKDTIDRDQHKRNLELSPQDIKTTGLQRSDKIISQPILMYVTGSRLPFTLPGAPPMAESYHFV